VAPGSGHPCLPSGRRRIKPRAEQKEGLLFLKKKKQKDFYSSAAPKIEAMAGILPQRQK
jgi:hypothetical protein